MYILCVLFVYFYEIFADSGTPQTRIKSGWSTFTPPALTLYQCITDNLIIGYAVCRTADGNSASQRVGTPYVTLKGLNFMDSVNQARALDVAKKAEQNSVSAKLKANKSFIVSIVALIATLIINADKIIHNLRAILSYLSTL